MFFNMTATTPIIGFRAVAGVMGAYVLLLSARKVLTFIPIIIIPYIVHLPAWLFLGIWFLSQMFAGLFEQLGAPVQGIAWWAHVGGFVAGMVLVRLFMKPERCYYCSYKGARQDFNFK
jgi:membrane associated rhomboid family serine protease